MWSFKQILATTVCMFRSFGFWQWFGMLYFFGAGALILQHGGGRRCGGYDDLALCNTILGLWPILLGLGLLAFRWLCTHVDRMHAQHPPAQE